MLGSTILYVGICVSIAGLGLLVRPLRKLGVPTRARAALVIVLGAAIVVAGAALPARESNANAAGSHLDEFMPTWQFQELHTIDVLAPPDEVYNAMKDVRADEIAFYRALTWIRRGGRPLPGSILDAGTRESLIDVALTSGFVVLADEFPRELVIGTVVMAPRGWSAPPAPSFADSPVPSGFALAAMNFAVARRGDSASVVTTETRVFASDPATRRRLAVYWRVIRPGSAIIRRMWLRAIRERAMDMRVGRQSVTGPP